MKILAIESSGMSAGCAYLEDDRLISEYYMNSRLTHSITLLPMISEMAKTAGFKLEELDAVAVSAGPGSFTGLRIGAATAKGLCLANETPLIAVSSLKGLAANLPASGDLICPLMDARRGQVYCGILMNDHTDGWAQKTVMEDSALTIEEYLEKILVFAEEKKCKAVFIGDGAPVHEKLIREKLGDKAVFAPTTVNRQRASSVALLASEEFRNGNTMCSDDFVPEYLRRPLAETSKEDGTLEDAGIHSLKKISRGDFKRTKYPEKAE